MSEKKPEALCKFTLFTKKTVTLREVKLHHTRTASQLAGKKAGDNQAYLGILMQEEMCRLLVVHIDDEIVSAAQKENLDNLFSVKEYNQVLTAIQKMGGDEVGEPVLAIDTSGN